MRLWPFTRKPAVTEQKQLVSPDALMLDLFGLSQPTATGVFLSQADAIRIPVVANAIQLISEAVASLDVMVKRVDGQDEVDVPDHPLLALLRDEPNEWSSGFELIRQIVRDALMNDAGGLAWVNRVHGEPREVIRYRNSALQFDLDVETGERRYRLLNRAIPARDVIHLLPPLERSPLTLAREAIGIAAALDRHAGRLFSRGARPSGAVLIPKGMGEEAIKAARAGWRQAHEGEDQGRTAFLYDGMTFTPFTFNSTDAQFLENRRFQVEEIARCFNIPAPMVGDLSRATWSNSEQKGREFLSYTLEPWLRGLEGALRRALFSEDERATHVIRFDRDDLTRADLATRATTINSLIASRTINPNEGRSWLGLPPREGGDEFLNPNISAAPSNAPDEGNSAETTGPKPGAGTTEEPNGTE